MQVRKVGNETRAKAFGVHVIEACRGKTSAMKQTREIVGNAFVYRTDRYAEMSDSLVMSNPKEIRCHRAHVQVDSSSRPITYGDPHRDHTIGAMGAPRD